MAEGFAAEADVALSLIAANRGSKMKFAVITLPYSVDTHKGAAAGPDALLQAGLADWLREEGHDVVGPVHVKLTPGEEAAYGAWNKIGFANAHLARLVSEAAKEQAFPLLLESNCYGAIGALAGLQMSADPPSPRHGRPRGRGSPIHRLGRGHGAMRLACKDNRK